MSIVNPEKKEIPSAPPAEAIVEDKPTIQVEQTKAPTITQRQNDTEKSKKPEFTDPNEIKNTSKVKNFNDDLLERLNIHKNIQLDDGPTDVIIDVQPDYRNCFLVILYYITKIYESIPVKINSYITPPSLMAYCLSLIYGHALINETSGIRTTRSQTSAIFTASDIRKDLLTILENAYVPSFLTELIESLMPSTDPNRPGIQFIHSLACYLQTHDFGRAYPIPMFLAAHNLIATRQANVPVQETLEAFYNTPLLTNNNANALLVKNVIGTMTSQGTYQSVIVRAITTLFNPVTQRTNSMRPTFTPIQMNPHPSANDDTVNPYLYLLGAGNENIHETIHFIENMSEELKNTISCPNSLGSLFDSQPTTQIQVHHYSQMSFPTWYPPQTDSVNTAITANTYAQAIGFMQPLIIPDDQRVNIPYPVAQEQRNLINRELYLVNANRPDLTPNLSPDTTRNFRPEQDITPDVLYFNPYDYTPSSFSKNVLNGLKIETNHISGFHVPQPIPIQPLNNANSHYLNSAIPARYITPETAKTPADPYVHYNVAIYTEELQGVAIQLGDPARNRIPRYPAQIYARANTQIQRLQGFHPVEQILRLTDASNRFAFRHGSINNPQTDPQFGIKKFNAWSSYRWYNPNLARTSALNEKINLILNMRTLYGTNVTLGRSRNPFLMIPTA